MECLGIEYILFPWYLLSRSKERDKTKHWAPPAEVVAFFEKHPAPLYVPSADGESPFNTQGGNGFRKSKKSFRG